MATKVVNGVRVVMSAQEEADFNASRIPSMAKALERVNADLKAKRTTLERRGIDSGGRLLSVTAESLARLQAARDNASPGSQVPVEYADGSLGSVPAASLNGLIQAAQVRLLALMQVEQAKRAEVAALPDAVAVMAYNIEAGWPA